MMHTEAVPQRDVVIRSAVPTFLVANIADTLRWCETNLGFRTAGTVPKEEPFAYASVQRGPAEIMLLALAQRASRRR